MFNVLYCPNCNTSLEECTDSYKCLNGHSFDKAKQGYVNLLLSNHKKTSDPGDNKNMISAREEFLSLGHYNFLIDEISVKVNQCLTIQKEEIPMLLDLGCGSGYYTRNIAVNKEVAKVGIDISKNAVTIAARKDNGNTYAVASAFRLPIRDEAADIVVNVFSPLDLSELVRVLNPQGKLIKVIPGPDHMKEIAELVYDTFKPHSTTIIQDIKNNSALEIMETQTLDRTIRFGEDQLKQLINMTPYKYKFDVETLSDLKEMVVTISFVLILAQRIKD